jgi:hypothetical protein
MGNFKKKSTDEQILNHAIAVENTLKACVECWKTGMKARPISSSEYQQICSLGKKLQLIRNMTKEDLFRRFGPIVANETMPLNVHCGFN